MASLCRACDEGYLEIAKVLIDRKANVEAKEINIGLQFKVAEAELIDR